MTENKSNINFLPHLFTFLNGIFLPFGTIAVLTTYLARDTELKKATKSALNWHLSCILYTFVDSVIFINNS